jgi:ADP-ribose pyrophosphatase YjhB (NUDIX family)
MPLRVSAYTQVASLPDEIVTSIRCIVMVEDMVVLCENKDGSHAWPGGRRLPGESYADTAAREVHEETGWLLDCDSLKQLGWLHLMHLSPQQGDDRYPYPDFLQVVFCARVSGRSVGHEDEWMDVDGYESSSRLVTVAHAMSATSADLLGNAFLKLLGEGGKNEVA